MKVKCVADKVSIKKNNKALVDWANNSELEITIGKTYIVIAISKYLNFIFYYILGDESDLYPLAFPAELFLITESKISKYWETDLTKIEFIEDINIKNGDVVSFKEWKFKGDIFYENLMEEVPEFTLIFNNYRDKILSE